MNKKKFRDDLQLKKVILKQIFNYEMVLRAKKLKQSTIDRKINDIQQFYIKLYIMRENKYHTTYYNISEILFKYIRDGNFSDDNLENCGTYGYRISIYNNIKDGFNYIYEKLFKEKDCIVEDLNNEQKEILNEISKNKWFKCVQPEDDTESIQIELIKQLGIKVYFDKNNKPYVLSHELAELIGKRNVEVMNSLKLIFNRFTSVKNSTLVGNIDISMLRDKYITKINNGGSKENITYRLSKDLTIHYILGLTGTKYSRFKFEYQAAFNYIEKEHDRLLEENAELKRTFLKMYNDMRIENRNLLLKNE
jgi:phage regulator Rha-like protein